MDASGNSAVPSAGQSPTDGADGRDRRNQALVFSVLFAIGTIAHVLRKAHPNEVPVWVLMISCVLLLDRPSSRFRLGLVALAYLAYFWTQMPIVGNHAHMLAFANLGILAVLLFDGWRTGRGTGAGIPLPLQYLRLTLLLSYGASAIAKLNSGFFDPEVSCAVGMCVKALAVFGVQEGSLPGWFESLLPYVIAGTELLIPILLIGRRTRRSGIVLVVAFHLIMSFSPTSTAIDFTLVLMAFLFLFFPTTTATRVVGDFRRILAKLPEPLASWRTAWFILGSFVLAVALLTDRATVLDNRNWLITASACLVVAPLFVYYAARTEQVSKPIGELLFRAGASGALATVLGFLLTVQLLNIAAPYLGGKNLGTFTMYSNLRTEAGLSNHFLIPRSPWPMGQDDLVEVIASSNRELESIGAHGQLISWHELRRILSKTPEAQITYRRGGVESSYAFASENPELVRLDPIAHKLIGHRRYDPRLDTCRH